MELWIDIGEVAVLQHYHCGTLAALVAIILIKPEDLAL